MNPLSDDLDHILDHTQDLWDDLREKSIFITGGTGFFGCWLLESFICANERFELNANAVVLTRNYKEFFEKAPHLVKNPYVKFHIGNVRDFKFPDTNFSHIIHAASDTSTKYNEENPLLMVDTIVQGTNRVLDFAVSCRAKKFLFISSGAVYGEQPPNISHIPEDYYETTNPTSNYGKGKHAAEQLCLLYSAKHDIEIKIARCFTFLGPYMPLDHQYAIGNFINNGLKCEPIEVKGNGKTYRSYLYAADLVIWLWTILVKGKSCIPYNVGSGNDLTIADLANTVAEFFNPRPEVKIFKPSTRKINDERYVPSVERAKTEL